MKKLTIAQTAVITTAIVLHTFHPLTHSAGQGNCSPGFVSKDESSPFTYSGTSIIDKVEVKAGSAQSTNGNQCISITSNGSNSCYEVSGLGTTSVSVTKVGSGPNCKDISHVEFYISSVTPTVQPTPTTVVPTNAPTATPTQVPQSTPTNTPIPTDSVTPTQMPDPTATPTSPADPTNTPTDSQNSDNPSPTATPTQAQNVGGANVNVTTTSNSTGQITDVAASTTVPSEDVLGATTLANTGTTTTTIAQIMSILGTVTALIATYGYRKSQ